MGRISRYLIYIMIFSYISRYLININILRNFLHMAPHTYLQHINLVLVTAWVQGLYIKIPVLALRLRAAGRSAWGVANIMMKSPHTNVITSCMWLSVPIDQGQSFIPDSGTHFTPPLETGLKTLNFSRCRSKPTRFGLWLLSLCSQ